MRYVALLRAINVGGHVVKMDALRKMFEALGFTDVETIIASGNVVFASTSKSPATLERSIEGHLHKKLGYPVATFLRTPSELADIVRYKPFKASELDAPGHSLYVGFLTASPTVSAQKSLVAFANDADDFHVDGREVYWLCRKKFNESKFSGAKLERTLGMPTTLRNVTTVRRIAAKFALALVLCATPCAARAQTPATASPLETADGVVRELYRLVTVEKGEVTDWEAVRTLFLPQAVIVLRVSKDASTVFNVQGWIDDFADWDEKARVKERGFSETILVLKPRVFRDIANVFVLYEAAITDSDKPATRGVDSIELIRKGERWWIAAITNDLPNAANPIPPELQE